MPYNPTNWQNGPGGGTPLNAARLNNLEGGISGLAAQQAADEALSILNPQSVKTANYSAAVGDFVPVDASSGPVAIALPLAPANKSRVAVKKMDSSSNAVTVTVAGGADVINQSGTTLLTLVVQFHSIILQYSSSSAIWYVVSTDAPVGSLVRRKIVSVSGSVTLPNLSGQDVVALVGSGGAPTLPTAVSNSNKYTVKNVDTSDKTIATTSSQTIDGVTTLTISFGDCVDLVSDGANWQILGSI